MFNKKIKIKIHLIIFYLFLIIFQYKIQDNILFYLNKYKISVIVPIFNSVQYLEFCLKSIVNQTLNNIEIIFIDDGNKDNTLLLLKKYQKTDKRIKIISQNHQGSGIARNNGIKNSNGKFIAFMDSDDLYPNNNILELLYNSATRNNALICGGGLTKFTFFNNSIKLLDSPKNRGKMKFQKEKFFNYYDYQYDFGYYRFIYKNTFLKKKKIFFPNYLRYQDPPFFIKAMFYSKKFYAIKEITYYYRISNKTWKWNKMKIIDQYKGFELTLQLSEKFNLNKLYCKIIKRINTSLFLFPTKKFIKKNDLKNLITRILKHINNDIIQKERCFFKLNNIYSNILN